MKPLSSLEAHPPAWPKLPPCGVNIILIHTTSKSLIPLINLSSKYINCTSITQCGSIHTHYNYGTRGKSTSSIHPPCHRKKPQATPTYSHTFSCLSPPWHVSAMLSHIILTFDQFWTWMQCSAQLAVTTGCIPITFRDDLFIPSRSICFDSCVIKPCHRLLCDLLGVNCLSHNILFHRC